MLPITPTPALPERRPTMSLQPRPGGLEIEHVGRVAVVKVLHRQVLTEEAVENLGRQLLSLTDDSGHRHVVLDFNNVERLSSALVGRLVALQGRLRQAGGRLALCGVRPEFLALLRALRLRRHLNVCGSEDDALQPLL